MRYDFGALGQIQVNLALLTASDMTASRRDDHLTKLGVASNHALRRSYTPVAPLNFSRENWLITLQRRT
jgi:hypothetical protein